MDLDREEKNDSYLEVQVEIAKFEGILTCSIFY